MSSSAELRFRKLRRPRVSWRQSDMDLGLGLEQPRDSGHAARPSRGFHFELFPSGAGKFVKLCAARVFRFTPLRVEPSGAFEPLQRGQQRAGIDLKYSAGDLLDSAGDSETVHRLKTECLEDEHI